MNQNGHGSGLCTPAPAGADLVYMAAMSAVPGERGRMQTRPAPRHGRARGVLHEEGGSGCARSGSGSRSRVSSGIYLVSVAERGPRRLRALRRPEYARSASSTRKPDVCRHRTGLPQQGLSMHGALQRAPLGARRVPRRERVVPLVERGVLTPLRERSGLGQVEADLDLRTGFGGRLHAHAARADGIPSWPGRPRRLRRQPGSWPGP